MHAMFVLARRCPPPNPINSPALSVAVFVHLHTIIYVSSARAPSHVSWLDKRGAPGAPCMKCTAEHAHYPYRQAVNRFSVKLNCNLEGHAAHRCWRTGSELGGHPLMAAGEAARGHGEL